jgi:hypothetical protein
MKIMKDGCLKKVSCPQGHAITVADNFPMTYDSLFCSFCNEKYPLKPGVFGKVKV